MTSAELMNLRATVGELEQETKAVVLLSLDDKAMVSINVTGSIADHSFLLTQFQVFVHEILAGRLKFNQPGDQ